MSFLYSWSAIQTKLQNDLDLINEPFLTPTELLGYVNEAIEDSETAIHTFGLGADYFRVSTFRLLTPGQSNYLFPTDIYANKIRRVFYRNPVAMTQVQCTTVLNSQSITVASAAGLGIGQNVLGPSIPLETFVTSIVGTTVGLSKAATASSTETDTFVSLQPITGSKQYEIKRMRRLEDTQRAYVGDDYSYDILNYPLEAGGNQIVLYPPNVDSGPFMQIFYLREMRRLTLSTTDPLNVCEIPECINFIFKHVKWNVSKKRRSGTDVIADNKADMQQAYTLMEETLKEAVPDENNKVLHDLNSYYDQETERYY